MLSGLVLVLPLLAVAVTVVVVLLVVPRRRALARVDDRTFPGLARLRRSTTLARVASVAVGLAVVVPVASAGSLGRGVALVPAAFAAVQVLGVLLADVIGRGDARTPGAAGLEVRRRRDYVPRGLLATTTVAGAVLVALLGWTTAVASPDDLGRAGRAVRHPCTSGCTWSQFSPFPGSYYSVPLAFALLVVALLAVLAVTATVRRPRDGSDPVIVRVDDAVRRRSVESVVAAVGIAIAGSLSGVGMVVGTSLAGRSTADALLQAAGWTSLVAALAALVLLVWCAVVLLVPGPAAATTAAPVRDRVRP